MTLRNLFVGAAVAGGGGSPELTGTPATITWTTAQDPPGQSITIPSDATAVYMFWTFWGTGGAGLASATLNSVSPNETHEIPVLDFEMAAGVAAWYNPATGSRTLDVAWDSGNDGPTTIVAFVKGGNTTAWRDADADQGDLTAAVSVTITTVADDLVLKMDARLAISSPPSLSSGWTNAQTHNNTSYSSRLSSIIATGTTQVCNSEDESSSTVCAISIPPA